MNKSAFKIALSVVVVIILALFLVVFWPSKNIPTVPYELEKAFNAGDFDRVVSLANDLLSKNSNHPYALLFLSQTYAQKGSLEFKEGEYGTKALDYAMRAKNLIPKDPRVYIAIGYANEIMQKYPEAILAYNHAVDLDNLNVDAYVHRGHAYDLSGDYEKAKADYEKAHSLDSMNVKVAQNLGRLAINENDSKEAEKQFLFVSQNAKNLRLKAEAYYNLSTLAYLSTSSDRYAKSLSFASSSVATDASYANGYLALGRAQVGLKDYKTAKLNLDKAIEIYPEYSLAYQILSDLYSLTEKRLESAEALAKQSEMAKTDIGIMESDRKSVVSKAALNSSYLFASLGQKDRANLLLADAVKWSDSLTLLIIQMTISDAKNNSFKSLVGDVKFEMIRKDVGQRISQSVDKTVSDNSVVSKFFAWFKTNTAEAAVVTQNCVIGNQTISFNGTILKINSDSNSITDTYAAKIACAALYDSLSKDGTYLNVVTNYGKLINDGTAMTLNQIRFYINSLVQQVNAAHGLNSSSLINYGNGRYYYGCANGLGSSYVPAASIKPTGLTAVCSSDGLSATLAWSKVDGANAYALRVNNTTANGWNNLCDGSQYAGDTCQTQAQTSATVSTVPGASYTWWVHSIVDGVISDSSIQPTFSCQSSLQVACSASPLSGNVPIDVIWTATATGGSGNTTYSWTGTDGLTGSGSTVTKHYTSDGVKYATTTVMRGTESKTIACPGSTTTGPINPVCLGNSCSGNSDGAPIITFYANPSSVSPGGSTTLNWSATNPSISKRTTISNSAAVLLATESDITCTASGNWSGSKNPVGSELQANINSSKIFVLTCRNSSGTTVKSVNVDVNGASGAACYSGILSSAPANPYLCDGGSASSITGDGTIVNPWSWSCSDQNSTVVCLATENEIITDPSMGTLDCELKLTSDKDPLNQSLINKNTTWEVQNPPANMVPNWKVDGKLVENNSNTLSLIFDKIGLKTVSVSYSSSTALGGSSELYCANGKSTATTTIVFKGNYQER